MLLGQVRFSHRQDTLPNPFSFLLLCPLSPFLHQPFLQLLLQKKEKLGSPDNVL